MRKYRLPRGLGFTLTQPTLSLSLGGGADARCAPRTQHGAAHTEHLYQPETEAGDVVLFTESSFHGTLPWTAATERRVGLYRFAPATMAYGRAYFPQWCAQSSGQR
jgi:hypothetical protein